MKVDYNNMPEAIEQLFEEIASLKRIILNQPAKQEKESSQYYTRKQARLFLKISMTTLAERTKDGTIKAKRLGGRVLYDKADLEAALNKTK